MQISRTELVRCTAHDQPELMLTPPVTEASEQGDTVAATPLPERRPIDRLLSHLDHLAERSDHLIKRPFGQFTSQINNPRLIQLGLRVTF